MWGGVIDRLLGLLLVSVYRARLVVWYVFRPVTMGVRVIVIKDDQLLLVRGHQGRTWHLPGGAVGRNETLAEAARREAHEETGCVVEVSRLVGMYFSNHEYKSDHVAIFAARASSPIALKPNIEIAEARYFPLADLPRMLAPYVRPRLDDYFSERSGILGNWDTR